MAGKRIVLLGPPGAGKGTQAKRLAQEFRIPHVATGDLFRDNVKNETDVGREAKSYMDRGELVPDDVVNRMVRERLEKPDCAGGFILDGYPRSVPQAEALDGFLDSRDERLDRGVFLTVPEEKVVARLTGRKTCSKCGMNYHETNRPPEREGRCDECGGELVSRKDDTPETVRNRLKVYNEQNDRIVRHYRAQGKLTTVDGNRGIDEVHGDLRRILEDTAGARA